MTAKPIPDVLTNDVNIEPSAPLILPVKNNSQADDVKNIYPRLELSNLVESSVTSHYVNPR